MIPPLAIDCTIIALRSFAIGCPDALAALDVNPHAGVAGIGPESCADEIEFGLRVHCVNYNALDIITQVAYKG